jgi:hypothetical protein
MTKWENMAVTITYTEGDGGKINFDAAAIQPPDFRFRGVYLPLKSGGSILSHYVVEFNTGYMVDWWSGVHLFPLGTNPPPAIGPLPPYDNSLQTMLAYRNALLPIRTVLSQVNNSCERLEGYMGVIFPNVPCVDRVQVVYIKGAIAHSDKTTSDLVHVYFSYADDRYQPRENGGGTGPPH